MSESKGFKTRQLWLNNIPEDIYVDGLKKKYNVMSIQCLVINDEHVSFGKKNINQVIDIVKQV